MTCIRLEGNVGPAEVASLRRELDPVLEQDRPFVEIDLTGVKKLHLAAVNVLLSAERAAEERYGTLLVRSTPDTEPNAVLGRAGLFRTPVS